MKINLSTEIKDHFERLRTLSDAAVTDEHEKMSAKASVMSAMTALLRELTKTQEQLVNMERLLKVEQALIETVKEVLDEEGQKAFTKKLKELLK